MKLCFIALIIFTGTLLINCSAKDVMVIPKQKYYSFQVTFKTSITNDSINYILKNPSNSPMRFISSSSNTDLQEFISRNNLSSILLNSNEEKIIQVKNETKFTNEDLQRLLIKKAKYGDYLKPSKANEPIALPFSKGKKYSILQGNNSSFTHNQLENKFAIDFKMDEGEIITAVYDGVVVAEVDNYTMGGANKKLKDYGNYITIYHKELNTYSIYFHLKPNSSMVQPGELVKKYQVIGYSGNTGYSTEPHLHFCYSKPDKDEGLISIPIIFENNLKGVNLIKGQSITHD